MYCFVTGHISFHMIVSRPSSPGVFHNLAAKSCRSISSIVIVSIVTGALCGLEPSSSILSSNKGENLVRNSSAYSMWLLIIVPSVLTNYGIFPITESSPDFRYFAVFQILSLSARNLFQYFFFCWQIAS